jgi:hypothetical protein
MSLRTASATIHTAATRISRASIIPLTFSILPCP